VVALPADLQRRLLSVPVGRLATVNREGEPDLVPVTFALLDDCTLVTAVDHKPKTTAKLARLDNVRRHPGVTVLVDHYDDDWSTLWWVRLRGRAEVVESGPSHERAVAALVARYQQYRGRPPSGAAIVVTVTDCRSWAATAK
jgi:PPOX class probable F420-dependent enzyme